MSWNPLAGVAGLSRRAFIAGGACGCALHAVSLCAAVEEADPLSLKPLIAPGYEPTDVDERGLWHECARLEEKIATSNLLVSDPAVTAYVGEVVQRLLGPVASDVRIYVVRDASFNASMAPNGMMIVHTGLLAHMRNEGQLAAVLGHESGHYLRRHSVQNWRSVKSKSAVAAYVGVVAGAAAGTSTDTLNIANGINSMLVLSLFSFSRDLESEADAYGLQLLARAGYPPHSADQVWSQLIEERQASAAARKKTYRDRADSAFSTHPASDVRMSVLAATAARIQAIDKGPYDDRRAAWIAGTAQIRPKLLEEQVKLNDPGASLYLLNTLAEDGWDSTLRFYEGEAYRLRDEPGDAELAAQAYAAAVRFADIYPDAYRAHGYALLKAGRREEGRVSLQRYLELRPAATDAAMVRFTLAQ